MFTIKELPIAMGFGKLNMQLITEDSEQIFGVYDFEGTSVHSITYYKSTNRFEIEDVYDYETGMITFSSVLIDGVIEHFNGFNCLTNSIFKLYSKKLSELGNVSVENLASKNDEGGTYSYFPAGRHILLRLPVVSERIEAVIANNFINNTINIDLEHNLSLRLLETYSTYILITEDKETSYLRPIIIYEYIVSLAAVYDAINWFIFKELIETEKVLRLVVQDSKEKLEHSFETYDDEFNRYSSFSILYKGKNEKEVSFKKLKEQVENEFDYKL